jgi:CRISPR/Cas system-associated endonuclease Cas1
VAAGYDLTIGLIHSGREGRGRHDFVLDLMEPLRPFVDRRVLAFVRAQTFHPADFTIRSDGVCRLNPEMATNIVKAAAVVALPQRSLLDRAGAYPKCAFLVIEVAKENVPQERIVPGGN